MFFQLNPLNILSVHKVPDNVKLCNKHDLFLQYLNQTMKIGAELRFTCCIYIQHNADATLFYDSKNPSTIGKRSWKSVYMSVKLHTRCIPSSVNNDINEKTRNE